MALEMLWSFVDSESRGSLQGGEHATDLDSLVENGYLNASGVYQNGLSEGLEPSPALGTIVKSQDGGVYERDVLVIKTYKKKCASL
ncbi:hypothetical protein Ddye_007828 [Dipteronia dyeriana]|uniref:Uncharacterized protein n=1 Tax=Dipteronia dyeriana TaxID=168575 RepID=A0AAD9XL74_9ROSI|nr:hypothetical protein Ddye_007828 [Dipteronia dyeriana]